MGKGSTETITTQIGESDAAATEMGRVAGQQTATAANATPWAQGLDPLTGQAIGQYGQQYDQYGQYGDQFNQWAQQGMATGMQTGLEGLGGYMNPMMDQYRAGMDPMYARAYEQAGQTAGQNATMQGAFGGSRSAIMEGQMRGDVQRSQMADYGQRQYQSAQEGARMMMEERARMGGYGQNFSGMGMNALAGQGDVTRNQAIMGDYRRNVAGQQAQDEYMRRAAAQQAITGSYGRTIQNTTTTEKPGDLLGDVMSVGGTLGGFAFGGGGDNPMADLGVTSAMAQATQPGPIQGPSAQPINFAQWNDPWGGFNG